VPSKTKPLTDRQLQVYEAKRDLASELLESVRQMKAGKTRVVLSPATEARERTGADLGVGIEGGVQRDARGVWVSAWVAVVDASGREGLGSGLRFRLPGWMASRAAAGEELGTIVDTYVGEAEAHETWGAIGLLTAGLVDRQAALEQAIAAALPPFLRSPLYELRPDD